MAPKRSPASRVREPLQIHITADERRLLDSLAAEMGLSRAEILRQGLRDFAAEHASDHGPMQDLVQSLRDEDWPPDVASAHDDHLADVYLDEHRYSCVRCNAG